MSGVLALDAAGRLAVAVALAWAATGKLADLRSFRATLYRSRLTRSWVPQLAVALPAVELALACGLAGARAAGPAALASALLLAAFTAYLALDPAAAQGCACFGARAASSRRAGLVRDVLLLAALVPVLARGPGGSRWGVPAAAEPWAAAVAAPLLAAGIGWAFHRDAGARRPRRRAGVPPVPVPAVRRAAHPFDVPALDGARLRLADLAARPHGVVLIFAEPGCARCGDLAPALAARADVVVLAAVDRPGDAAVWATAHGLPAGRVAADVGGALADAYGITANPAAVRVGAQGVLVDATGRPVARPAVGTDAVLALLPSAALDR